MSTKVPIYLKRGSRKGKKEKLRDILSSDMISPPLGDFRHTIHVGSGGQSDAFGDISFLQGNLHLLPGGRDAERGGAAAPLESSRAAPPLQNAVSLPALGAARALSLPAARAPPKPPRLRPDEAPAPPSSPRPGAGEAEPFPAHAGSLLSLHVDLGPSILEDVLRVMDRHRAERGARPEIRT
nr:cdc42 effector protein 2 [Lonchura striata domestica]